MNNSQKVLLIGEKDIKEASLIQLNVDTKVLSRTIFDTQNVYLRPILGDDLFGQIINGVFAGTLSTPLTDLLVDYVQPYLTHAVTQDVIINVTYKLSNKGLLKFNDTAANSPSDSEIEYARNYFENKTQSYKAALISAIKNGNFTPDTTPSKDRDITTDSIGWFLGSPDEGCGCGNGLY